MLKKALSWQGIAFLIVLAGFVSPFITFNTFYSRWNYNGPWPLTIEQIGKLGQVSDWIGGVTIPFFTLASFIILFLAFKTQTEELGLTRQELSSTREQFIQQNTTLARQRFEGSYFQLLSFHHEIVNGTYYALPANGSIDAPLINYNGRSYYEQASIRFTQLYNGIINAGGGQQPNQQTDMRYIVDAWTSFFSEHQRFIGHYFRNLYHIVKFVDETPNSVLSPEEKYDYVRLLRAQLSSYELVLLFYNCMVGEGYDKFRPLIEKYHLFDNINTKLLGKHWGYYGDTALWNIILGKTTA
ncbi:MAG: putative phage abortive infection protein [Sporomusaceae bacterium]|nr:putative phage abortive infection protein [Sporomusaceae bacterium]